MTSSSASDNVTRPLDAMAAAIVVVLCLSWGFNQVSVKLAIQDIPPLTQAAVRSVLATVLIAGWCKLRGIPMLRRDGTLWLGIAAGALFAAEFTLIYQGLLYTTATRAVLFIYLAPFLVVLGGRIVLPADRLVRRNGSGCRCPLPACSSLSACRLRRSTRVNSSAT